jgi:hypothetical protein
MADHLAAEDLDRPEENRKTGIEQTMVNGSTVV